MCYSIEVEWYTTYNSLFGHWSAIMMRLEYGTYFFSLIVVINNYPF